MASFHSIEEQERAEAGGALQEELAEAVARAERAEAEAGRLRGALQAMVEVTFGSLYEPLARARDAAQFALAADDRRAEQEM